MSKDMKLNVISVFCFFLLIGCADITKTGSKVKFIEEQGGPLAIQEKADKLEGQFGCKFIGYVDAKTSLFPGSYSIHENEVHTALRNKAGKMGANLVIANFYKKPAQGIGLVCPEGFLKSDFVFSDY